MSVSIVDLNILLSDTKSVYSSIQMAKTICQSVAWFKRHRTLKSVPVGRVGSGRVGRVAQVEKIIIFSEKSLGLQPRS